MRIVWNGNFLILVAIFAICVTGIWRKIFLIIFCLWNKKEDTGDVLNLKR